MKKAKRRSARCAVEIEVKLFGESIAYNQPLKEALAEFRDRLGQELMGWRHLTYNDRNVGTRSAFLL